MSILRRIMVCELPDAEDFSANWARIAEQAQKEKPDVIVLPELPFSTWFACDARFNPSLWNKAVEAHRAFEKHLGDIGAAIIYSVAADADDGRRNLARCIDGGNTITTHAKRHLPDEAGYWEAHWYDRGNLDPQIFDARGMKVGVRLCTEMWNFSTAHKLGHSGADLIAIPRVTPRGSTERWVCGARCVAIASGAYCASSNRTGIAATGDFAGAGWVIDPDGEVLALTNESSPVVTCTIDLHRAREAKKSYPRYAIPAV